MRRYTEKAPNGFGLGGPASWDYYYNGTPLDDIIENGWHVVNKRNNPGSYPYDGFDTGTILVVARDNPEAGNNFAYQILFVDSQNDEYVGIRKCTGGAWGGWLDWTPRPHAPYGFGLGQTTVTLVDSLDDICAPGWYTVWIENGDQPEGAYYGHWDVQVTNFFDNDDFEIRLATTYGSGEWSTVSYIVNRKMGGVWHGWEWENPFLEFGIEYKTTERFRHRNVYKMLLSIGYIGIGDTTFTVPASQTGSAHCVSVKLYNNGHEDITNSTMISHLACGRYGENGALVVSFTAACAHGDVSALVEYVYI